MKMRHRNLALSILSLTGVLVVFGQGCSKSIQVQDPGAAVQELLQRGSGNGGHYGGKIEAGTYVRTVPSSKCGVQQLGQIVVTDSQIRSKQLDTETCQESESTIDSKSIDYASYAPGRLGLEEGLYLRDDLKPKAGEEAWCRSEDSDASLGFDIVIRAADGDSPIMAHVVSVRKNGPTVTRTDMKPFSVSRRLEMFERLEYEAEDFELEIRTSSPAKWAGSISADVRIRREGFKLDTVMRCRLGASLDPKYDGRPY